MKCMVVNGDDLGLSPGVNRGIGEAHLRGPLTSASLMVNMPASEEGACLARDLPVLSVGLHANLTDASGRLLVDLETGAECGAVLQQQLDTFQRLMGRLPTHLDSHHNVHRYPQVLPYFLDLAARYGMPLREHSPVPYVSSFYGQWGGKTHPEQISVQSLVRLLATEITEGITEMSCHPGYCDAELRSSYRLEREVELRSLCDSVIQEFLSVRQIRLVNFVEAMDLLTGSAQQEGSACLTS